MFTFRSQVRMLVSRLSRGLAANPMLMGLVTDWVM